MNKVQCGCVDVCLLCEATKKEKREKQNDGLGGWARQDSGRTLVSNYVLCSEKKKKCEKAVTVNVQ